MHRIVMYKTGLFCNQVYHAHNVYNVDNDVFNMLLQSEAGYTESEKPPWVIAAEEAVLKAKTEIEDRKRVEAEKLAQADKEWGDKVRETVAIEEAARRTSFEEQRKEVERQKLKDTEVDNGSNNDTTDS